MKRVVFIVTFAIRNLRKLRRYLQNSSININCYVLDISDVIDLRHPNFNGYITVSGDSEDLNVVYHIKNGKLDLEYLRVKDQLKDNNGRI